MKALKFRGKFSGRIYLHSICKRESRTMQTLENLRENLHRGKTTVKGERDFAKSEILEEGLSTLLQIQFPRVSSIAKEEEINFSSREIAS